jgi:hypothetical protein
VIALAIAFGAFAVVLAWTDFRTTNHVGK